MDNEKFLYLNIVKDSTEFKINNIVIDYGGSVKIHAKPTDTAESIVEELEKLLVIYKYIIKTNKISKGNTDNGDMV